MGSTGESRPITRDSSHAVHTEVSGANEDEAPDPLHSPSLKSIGRKSTLHSHAIELSSDSESEQEEFFDAVDAGEVDVEPMPPSDVVPSAGSGQDVVISGIDVSSAFKGYENGFRTRLKLDEDNRPKIGLWVSSRTPLS